MAARTCSSTESAREPAARPRTAVTSDVRYLVMHVASPHKCVSDRISGAPGFGAPGAHLPRLRRESMKKRLKLTLSLGYRYSCAWQDLQHMLSWFSRAATFLPRWRTSLNRHGKSFSTRHPHVASNHCFGITISRMEVEGCFCTRLLRFRSSTAVALSTLHEVPKMWVYFWCQNIIHKWQT